MSPIALEARYFCIIYLGRGWLPIFTTIGRIWALIWVRLCSWFTWVSCWTSIWGGCGIWPHSSRMSRGFILKRTKNGRSIGRFTKIVVLTKKGVKRRSRGEIRALWKTPGTMISLSLSSLLRTRLISICLMSLKKKLELPSLLTLKLTNTSLWNTKVTSICTNRSLGTRTGLKMIKIWRPSTNPGRQCLYSISKTNSAIPSPS